MDYLAGGCWIDMPPWTELFLGMGFRNCQKGEETLKYSHPAPFPSPCVDCDSQNDGRPVPHHAPSEAHGYPAMKGSFWSHPPDESHTLDQQVVVTITLRAGEERQL